MRSTESRNATFSEFSKFITEQAELATDPLEEGILTEPPNEIEMDRFTEKLQSRRRGPADGRGQSEELVARYGESNKREGDDQGLVQSATVRTSSGSTQDRPINKLILLVKTLEEEPEKTR